MNLSTLILSFLSLATGVASHITAEKHLKLFHELWDPVTKGHFAFKKIDLDMFVDDIIFRDPVRGRPELVGKEACLEYLKKGGLPRIPQGMGLSSRLELVGGPIRVCPARRCPSCLYEHC